jgi:DMSO/TMAO reductase YedYZ molybdopterin-dependent catalytic subunit
MKKGRKTQGCLAILTILLFCATAYAGDVILVVKGEIKKPLRLSIEELKSMPVVKVSVNDHDGSSAEYEGVSLQEILKRAGVPEGESLRGPALQLCGVVKAADNYKVVFSLAELDQAFGGKQVILAFRRNGEALDAKAGPLRLVIPGEKRQARWVRQVTELEIVRVRGESK